MSGVVQRHGPALLLVAAVAATVAALWPSVASLIDNWREIHDYRHGWLIAAVALGWLWWVGRGMDPQSVRFSAVGCLLLAATLLTWLVALRANSDIALELLFPPVLWFAVLAAAGWRVARKAIAPVAYLYFAIPVWEFLLPTLQWLSVAVTEAALAAAGVPAEVDEYSVTIPFGTFEIVEGCSGKRYFIASLAVAVVAGVLQRLPARRLVTLVAASGLIALSANWLRIFVVIYSGYVSEMNHYLVAVEHETFGNAVFLVLLVAIYLVSRRLRGPEAAPDRRAGDNLSTSARTPMRFPATAAIPFALLAATAALAHAPVTTSAFAGQGLGQLPLSTGAWQGPYPPSSGWSPHFAEPQAERRASYRRADGSAVEVYLNFYPEQRAGRELVYYANRLLAPGQWSRAWPIRADVLDSPVAPRLGLLEARGPSQADWLIAYVYKIGAWTTVREPLGQLAYGVQSILRPKPAGVLALAVQCHENCQEARALVSAFWDEMSTPLMGMIPDHAP